jgi:hypothetical protein
MDPLAVARSYFFLVEGGDDGGFGVVQQTARREGRRWVIGFIEAKERPVRRVAGRERRGIGL